MIFSNLRGSSSFSIRNGNWQRMTRDRGGYFKSSVYCMIGFISGGEARWPPGWWNWPETGLCACGGGTCMPCTAAVEPSGGVLTDPGLEALWPMLWLFSESESQSDFFSPLELCVLTCLDKWSLLMNLLLQIGQANLFSPVCVRRCRCNSSDRVKRFPQKSQLQTKGRSPVCHRRWALRWDVFP